MYCSRACKAEEAALRSVEAGALGKLAGISAARDVDVDLLRMVLRLLIVRAKALGLGPPDSSSSQDQEQQEEGEGGAKQEVRREGRRVCLCSTLMGVSRFVLSGETHRERKRRGTTA